MQQKQQTRPLTRILQVSTAILFIGIVLSGLFPDQANFHASVRGHSVAYLLLSVWAWLFLFWIIQEVRILVGVKFTRRERIIIAAAVAVSLAYYIFSLLTRRFIYYWDYVLYYRLQLFTAIDTEKLGLFALVVETVKSVWYLTYSHFINVFLAAPFAITPQTANWFVAVIAFTIIPVLYWVIAICLKLAERALQPVRSNLFFLGGMVFTAGFPVIHRSLLFGQPDLLGLVFAFLMIAVTITYDFSSKDIKRYFLIVALTIMTCASRRWYLFWLVAYLGCYGFSLIYRAIRNQQWVTLKRMILYCIIAGGFVVGSLFPMILRVFRNDYARSYSYYNAGGFPAELKGQAMYLGYGLVLLLGIGLVIGIVQKKTRNLALLAGANILFTILIFTRIQNMGLHHMLILVPAYLLLFLNLLSWIVSLQNKALFQITACAAIGFSSLNTIVCAASNPDVKMPAIFSNVPLILPKREDLKQIQDVNRWIVAHTADPDYVYMIPHGDLYNPDVFRNISMPNWDVYNLLPYGSAILGVHSFPEGLFTAKYVITCNPFCGIGISPKYNSAFLSEIPQTHFTQVEQFDMGNGYVFTIYQRITPTDREEIQFYEQYFAEENKQFPELFSDVWNDMLENLAS